MLARAWKAGAGPGDAPFTIDLDSKTYGLAKEGARHHGYTGARGYHPLLSMRRRTGDVLMARLREGRANTARGAAHFLRETVSRVRCGGASGQLTMRAAASISTPWSPSAAGWMSASPSPSASTKACTISSSTRRCLDAEDGPPPMWPKPPTPPSRVAAPVRLIVRRVKPAPGSQLIYSYHGFITDRDGETLELEADHRRHAEIENAIRDLKYGWAALPPTVPGWRYR